MKKLIIKELKERACVKGKQKTWISQICDDRLLHLFERLRTGESARSIAKFAQEEWGINPGSEIHSLSQAILKFRRRVADLLEPETAEQTCRGLEEANINGDEDLDELTGLARLVRQQRERVGRMMKEERELGIRHPTLAKDLQSFATLSKALTKLKEFSVKYPRDPIRTREEEMRDRRIDKNFNTFLANTSDDSRERLMCAMDKFLEQAAKLAIPMVAEKDENGGLRYVPVEKGGSSGEVG